MPNATFENDVWKLKSQFSSFGTLLWRVCQGISNLSSAEISRKSIHYLWRYLNLKKPEMFAPKGIFSFTVHCFSCLGNKLAGLDWRARLPIIPDQQTWWVSPCALLETADDAPGGAETTACFGKCQLRLTVRSVMIHYQCLVLGCPASAGKTIALRFLCVRVSPVTAHAVHMCNVRAWLLWSFGFKGKEGLSLLSRLPHGSNVTEQTLDWII